VHALAAKIARDLPAHFAHAPLDGAAAQQHSEMFLATGGQGGSDLPSERPVL
jgi:hypothetical protein